MMLQNAYDYHAPDGSEIRELLKLDGSGGLAHCVLPTGLTSKAHRHRTVGEIWYFLRGKGQVWRKKGDAEKVVEVSPNCCLTIEAGTHFQFRNTGTEPMTFIIATIPSWPGPEEATPEEGPWETGS